jgi:hypothetical protein
MINQYSSASVTQILDCARSCRRKAGEDRSPCLIHARKARFVTSFSSTGDVERSVEKGEFWEHGWVSEDDSGL